MDKSKIEALCEYLNENVAKRYPIANSYLENNTDYIKNGYLKMLAVVMGQSGNVTKEQTELFKRIIEGAKVDEKAEDYLRMALEIEINDYINFTDECKDLELKYRFILDAVILTCVKDRTEGQLALISQFCESYGITKEELQYIAMMAKSILNMSSSDYVSAYEVGVSTVAEAIFRDYMYLISKSCIYHNDHMTILAPNHKEDVTAKMLEKVKEINTPVIKICGVKSSINEYETRFKNKEKVILEDWIFVGGKKCPIYFENCQQIILKNCKFSNFETRTLYFSGSSQVLLDDCEFANCKYRYERDRNDWESLGGVIYAYNPNDIKKCDIVNTLFSDCGGINRYNYYSSDFICNIKSNVDNCKFKNCWNLHKTYDKDPENMHRAMFTKDSLAINCTYKDSASFN